MKSRVMKSFVEKSSSLKLGPWGNKALEPMMDSVRSALVDMAACWLPAPGALEVCVEFYGYSIERWL